jgi:hypothetical protein
MTGPPRDSDVSLAVPFPLVHNRQPEVRLKRHTSCCAASQTMRIAQVEEKHSLLARGLAVSALALSLGHTHVTNFPVDA